MSSTSHNVEEILEELRRTVAERRASGQYPEGMEEELDAHFARIVAARPHLPRLALFRRRVEAARRASRFSADRIPTGSQLPGGEALHRALTRVFLRQAHGILMQVQEFADRILEALDAAVAVVESPGNHRHADLTEILDAHSEALAEREKGPTLASDRLDDLLIRVERLEGAEASRRWQPWLSPARFDEAFHPGGRERVEQAVAAAVQGVSPVLDLTASDVGRPHDVLACLVGTLDGSLGGIVLVQAEDHAPAQDLLDLIGLAPGKLREGGLLVIAVDEPRNQGERGVGDPVPLFNPTLGPPLPLAYAAFACREAGFQAVEAEEWPPIGYLLVARR